MRVRVRVRVRVRATASVRVRDRVSEMKGRTGALSEATSRGDS